MSASSKPVKKMNLGDTEKEIFIRILKETDNGKIYDKLVHGIGTIQQRSDLWKMVREMFNRETGRDATVEQLRKLFGRMKDKVKKNHDEKRLKLYEKSCKLTGGGPGPHPLEDEDGDMVGENPTGFEPFDTPFNSLSTLKASKPSHHLELTPNWIPLAQNSEFITSIGIKSLPNSSDYSSSVPSCSSLSVAKKSRPPIISNPSSSGLFQTPVGVKMPPELSNDDCPSIREMDPGPKVLS